MLRVCSEIAVFPTVCFKTFDKQNLVRGGLCSIMWFFKFNIVQGLLQQLDLSLVTLDWTPGPVF